MREYMYPNYSFGAICRPAHSMYSLIFRRSRQEYLFPQMPILDASLLEHVIIGEWK